MADSASRPVPVLDGVRVVFFDIGGTLAYPHPSFNGLIAQVCQANGLTVTMEDAGRVEPLVWAHIARRKDAGRGFSLSKQDSQAFWHWVYQTYLTELGHHAAAETELPRLLFETFIRSDSYRLYEDVLPTLDRLRGAGFVLGVISNWEDWLERLLVDLAIHEYFDATVVSGRAGVEKPNPRIFELALEAAGAKPHESIHIGDNPTDDVAGAEGAGMRGILLDRSDRFAPVMPKPMGEEEATGRLAPSPGSAGDGGLPPAPTLPRSGEEGVVKAGPAIAYRIRDLREIPDLLGAP